MVKNATIVQISEQVAADSAEHSESTFSSHVARIAQRGCRGRHDGGHQLVDDRHVRRVHHEALAGNAIQCIIVQHNLATEWRYDQTSY